MKFVWSRVIVVFVLLVISVILGMLIHELGHAIFVLSFGGRITEFSLVFCGWEGLEGIKDSIATAGGITFALVIGLILLILLPKLKINFKMRFFIFSLLSVLLIVNLFYLVVHPLQSYRPRAEYFPSDILMLIERGIPAPVFLGIGCLLILIIMFPLKYIELLTFLYKDTINYISKDIKVEIKTF